MCRFILLEPQQFTDFSAVVRAYVQNSIRTSHAYMAYIHHEDYQNPHKLLYLNVQPYNACMHHCLQQLYKKRNVYAALCRYIAPCTSKPAEAKSIASAASTVWGTLWHSKPLRRGQLSLRLQELYIEPERAPLLCDRV